MLFNSASFILGFLPVTWIVFFGLGRASPRLAVIWLAVASVFFYGWWNPAYVPLLLGSVGFNYAAGRWLSRRRSKPVLIACIAADLALLGYYKYAGFLVATVNGATGAAFPAPDIVLPLAISFFTFQQIAFLVDSFDDVAQEASFWNYAMFVTFFPHLIAGPITHHKEMLPQFSERNIFRPDPLMIALGATLFLLGLCKKVMIADTLSPWVHPVFADAASGQGPELFSAWGASICYTMQIYFDFSGYTDMAIGIGMMFGIRLPLNFNSPYKAHNIIQYWSRWHMTLTRFLTAYIYNPVVMRRTRSRRRRGQPVLGRGKTTPGSFAALVAAPTMMTMLISGVWHGAGWQFIAFGALHGFYLTVNHAWRAIKASLGWKADSGGWTARSAGVLLTFACVLVALVFFRSADVPAAMQIVRGLAGLNGAALPSDFSHIPGVWRLATMAGVGFSFDPSPTFKLVFAAALFVVVWALPNTQQWLGRFQTALGTTADARPWGLAPRWRPSLGWSVAVGCLAFFSLLTALSTAPSEFLYFKF